MIEKPRHIRRNPKFLCRLCKGDHLTRLFPTTSLVKEAWSFPGGPSGSKSSLVSQHSNPSLVDTLVMSMKYSADTPLLLGGDASLDLVVSHPIQPIIVLIQYSTDTTPILGVMHLLTLLSHILFNHWLKKWSC
jgi:hypothetical protein